MVEKILAGRHILIAEDNLTNQIVVTKMIEILGGTYDLAKDGVEAIEIYQPLKYDLALLDIEMPRKSGIEVIRHIRADGVTEADFPIVALTAFVLDEHRVKIKEAGATAILAKPIFDVEKFGEDVSAFIPGPSLRESKITTGFDFAVLSDLESSLGADVTGDLLQHLDGDFHKISESLKSVGSPPNKELIRSNIHSLLSLAGMAGAINLTEECQNLHDEYANLSDDELLGAITDILKLIEGARCFVQDRLEKMKNA